jgi:hypothetical protein
MNRISSKPLEATLKGLTGGVASKTTSPGCHVVGTERNGIEVNDVNSEEACHYLELEHWYAIAFDHLIE